MTEIEKQKVIEKYFANDARLANAVVKKAVAQIEKKDFFHDDYSEAYNILEEGFFRTSGNGKTFLDSYDETMGLPLDNWIFMCLCQKLRTYCRDCYRDKRRANYDKESLNVSIEADDGSEVELMDIQPSEYSLENDVIDGNMEFSASFKCKEYINSLTKRQREIAYMLIDEKTEAEIKAELNISQDTLTRHLKVMRSPEKIRIINDTKKGEKEMVENFSGKTETSMSEALSIEMIVKKIEHGGIDFEHPLQRQSAQWNKQQKSDLITTILHSYNIPSIINAEQIIDGKPYIWCIDGKQRITTCYEFIRDEFKISKTAERPIIRWFEYVKDENGDWAKTETGSRATKTFEFDVRNKKFSDFPDNLQDMFKSYLVPIEKYLDCTDDDVEFHIRRYNASKVMSASQKGITHLGRDLAYSVKNIVAESEFIEEFGNYKESERKNGTIDRMIVESVMAINFLDDWKKKQEDMCEFLKENATIDQFEYLEDVMTRLHIVSDGYKDISDMWNSKDSFIWFAAFDKFTKLCKDDKKFFDFMRWFNEDGRHKEIDGVSFDILSTKATKDKSTVIGKIDIIDKLMKLCLSGSENFIEEDDSNLVIEDTNDVIEDVNDVVEDEEEYVCPFRIIDNDIREYIDRCHTSEFSNILDYTYEYVDRLAIKSLMIYDAGIDDFVDSDTAVQNYLNECILFGSEFGALEGYMEKLCGIYNDNYKLFAYKYIPAVINSVREFDDTEEFYDWISSYIEKFQLRVGDIDCKDCYEDMIEDINNYKEGE